MYGLPVWAGALLFIFYSNMVISPQSMVKLTGLLALFLLGITFVIGPLSLFSRYSNHLKIYRKYLGVTGFFVALLHATLAFISNKLTFDLYIFPTNFIPGFKVFLPGTQLAGHTCLLCSLTNLAACSFRKSSAVERPILLS